MKTKLSLVLLILALSKAFAKATAFKAAALCSVLCALSFMPYALSQTPQGFNYQAVARDASGFPIKNHSLPVRITIQSDSLSGTIFWQELHPAIITSDLGVINLVLGKGARQSSSTVATFSNIDWSVTPKFLKIEIDNSGWKTLGVSRLWSVPYALVAGDLDGPIEKLAIEGETTQQEEALFEVKNKDGQTVFAVYNEGVRVYVSDGAKALKGGFAVGGFGTDKAESTKYLFVGKDSVRIYLETNPLTKKLKGGFAVGGYDLTKGTVQNYLDVNADSVRIYIDSDPTTKKLKGGFAVGGYDMTKGTNTNYMNVNTDASGIINPSQNRILWFPLKNAFLTGRILIENKDSVGENSFASGYESKAKGMYSQALGYMAIARGDYSTAIGKNAVAGKLNSFAFGDGAKVTNNDSYAFGAGALATGAGSYAIGSSGREISGELSGINTIAAGDYSFAIGRGAISNGFLSLALGANVEALNPGSTAIGFYSRSHGLFSTAIGYASYASGENATAVGCSAIAMEYGASATGYYAIATGPKSASLGSFAVAEGNEATAIGRNSLASGDYSLTLGPSESKGDYSFAVGNKTSAASGYETVMGSFNTVYTPISTTDWNSGDRLFVIGNGQGEGLRSDAMVVLKNGNTGIGTSSPGYRLTVNGTAWCSSGAWTGSDFRWKKNIYEITGTLTYILKLKPVSYEWRTEEFSEMNFEKGTQIGLIAQDVQILFPELVKTDENGYKAVSYEKLSVILLEGMKEQQQQIESYKSQLQSLQEKIDKIEDLLATALDE